MNLPSTDADTNPQRAHLRKYLANMKAEYARFRPDFEQAKAYLMAEPFNEALMERFNSIANHLQSLENNITCALIILLGVNDDADEQAPTFS